MIKLKTEKQIEIMRIAGSIVKKTLDLIEQNIKVGVSTKQLDKIAYDFIISQNATPSFLNYNGFPASICTSINEVVVHGFPSDKAILKEGDIISVDIGAKYRGFHGDAARTFAVGKISDAKQKLIDVTKECFFKGISAVKIGSHLGDLSQAIQNYAESFGYGVVRELVGHGVGQNLHEDPMVPNYGHANFGPIIEKGLVIAVEPMINMGKKEVTISGDGWDIRTKDRKPSAHYENTICFTENGIEILTI